MNTNEKLDKLLQDTAVVKDAISDIKYDINNLQKVIYVGNGKPSLLTRVEIVEVHLDELKWWKRVALAGISTGVFGIALAMIERMM